MTGCSGPQPSEVYLLEHKDTILQGDISYGFLVPKPSDVFTLLYLFSEAGKGWCFTKSLEQAFENTSEQTIQLYGETNARYK